MSPTTRKARRAAIGGLLVIVLLVLFVYFREVIFKDRANQELHLWLTVLSGNWSADNTGDFYYHHPLRFSLAAVAAIAVNFGPYLVLFQFARSLLGPRERVAMYLIDLMRERDRAIKNSILNKFSDGAPELVSREQAIDMINEGFVEGDTVLDRQLEIAEPNREFASKIRQKMRATQIEP